MAGKVSIATLWRSSALSMSQLPIQLFHCWQTDLLSLRHGLPFTPGHELRLGCYNDWSDMLGLVDARLAPHTNMVNMLKSKTYSKRRGAFFYLGAPLRDLDIIDVDIHTVCWAQEWSCGETWTGNNQVSGQAKGRECQLVVQVGGSLS